MAVVTSVERRRPRWLTREVWVFTALAIAGLGLLITILIPAPEWLIGHEIAELNGEKRAAALNATRTTLLQGAAGLVAVAALVFTARTYLLAREGHITDRFTAAVDLLGAATVAQRTGGVFALERIMRDSSKDHWAVVEVLASFIRTGSDGARTPDEHELGRDIKAALTVLGRRPDRRELEIDRVRLSDSDLRGTLLRGGRLDRAALRGAQLDGVHWEHASLVCARLRKAHMFEADLEGAVLRRAGLHRADLTKANLKGTSLVLTDLSHAILTEADLTGAHLAGAKGAALSPEQLSQVHCRPEDSQSACQGRWSESADCRVGVTVGE